MNLKVRILLSIALVAGGSPADAEPSKDSPFRIHDCVPTDDGALKTMKALRADVRAAFSRQGGAVSTGPWTDSWQWAWERADDWVPISGDDGIVGLDSKTANMAALIPRGWTGPTAKGYDPIEDMEAAWARLKGWGETAFAGFAMRHPRDWRVRISSSADLTRDGGMWANLSVSNDGAPSLWLRGWRPATEQKDSELFAAAVGREVLSGYRFLGRDRFSLNGRSCRAAYLEGGFGAANKEYRWQTVLGCGFPDQPEDLHIVLNSSSYSSPGAGDVASVSSYQEAVRALCSILMVPAL